MVPSTACPQRPNSQQGTATSRVRLVVSAAVYWQVKTIRQLLLSIHAFLECATVLHLNALSSLAPDAVETLVGEPLFDGRALLNSERLPMETPHSASPNSLLDIHVSNFKFARARFGDMTHVLLMGEDERIVRPGLTVFLRSAPDAAISHLPRMGCASREQTPSRVLCTATLNHSCCPHKDRSFLWDPILKILSDDFRRVFYGQIEGALFRREIFNDVEAAYTRAKRTVNDNPSAHPNPTLGPQELYVPTALMRLPCVRVVPGLTYVNWRAEFPCKLCVGGGDVLAIQRGQRPGKFAVKLGSVASPHFRNLLARMAEMYVNSSRNDAVYTRWLERSRTLFYSNAPSAFNPL